MTTTEISAALADALDQAAHTRRVAAAVEAARKRFPGFIGEYLADEVQEAQGFTFSRESPRLKALLDALLGEKRCEGCHRMCVRRPSESNTKWEARRYCSHACANAARESVVVDEKTCARDGCDNTFQRDPSYEGPKRFAARKYCSPECAQTVRLAGACTKGHEYTQANTYVDPTGRKHCRTCRRQRVGSKPRVRKPVVRAEKPRAVTVFPGPQPTEVWRPASWRRDAS